MITASTDHQHGPLQHIWIGDQLTANCQTESASWASVWEEGKNPHDSYQTWTEVFSPHPPLRVVVTPLTFIAVAYPASVSTLSSNCTILLFCSYLGWGWLHLPVTGVGLWPRLGQWDIICPRPQRLVQGWAMTRGGLIKGKPWTFLESLGERYAAFFCD